MYMSFYNLDKKPFGMNPHPSFVWLSKKHNEALATLRDGILNSKGFLFLTGEAGCGKTVLVKTLTESLDTSIEWAVIVNPRLEVVDFYNSIAKGFGIEKELSSKVQFLIEFSHFLHKSHDENKKVLLLIDDCHHLSQEMLEELRLLSNIEKDDVKLINIFFVGLPEFNETLLQPRNRVVRQRLILKVELQGLTVIETGDYIRHRLKIAGTEEELFSEKAIQVVHRFSQGIPRRINTICDLALVYGSTQNKRAIDNKMIEFCIQKLALPALSHQEDGQKDSDGKNDFNHNNGKNRSKFVENIRLFLGTILKSNSRYSWLKYGFGILILLIAGVYFWYPVSRSLEKVEVVPVQIVKKPVIQTLSQVGSLPVVPALEKSKNGIDEKKAATLSIPPPEKAYNNDETKDVIREEVKEGVRVGVDALPAEKHHQPLATTVVEKVDSLAGQKITDPSVNTQHIVKEKTKVVHMEPMVPRKILLGLQPNSQNLTRVAQKEFDSFILKLKQYPRATVLVKGFVSAKTNSPENIKLSKDRAMTVQKLMLAKGIAPEQIEVLGMGNQEPIAPNSTHAGRKKNRRVEIVIVDDGIKEIGGN